MGISERDPNLQVVEQVGERRRALDRPQRLTRSAQLGNPPGYRDECGGSFHQVSGQASVSGSAPDEHNPFTQEFPQPQQAPPARVPEQFPDQYQPQRFGESPRPPRPSQSPRRPGYSDWEGVCASRSVA